MIITCICNAKLKIGDGKLTAAGVRIKCPKCGTVHVAKRPAPAPVEPPAPSMPWFASAANVQKQEKAAASPFPSAPAMPWFAPGSPAPLPGETSPTPGIQGGRPLTTLEPATAQTAAQGRQTMQASSLVLVAHDSKVVADMVQGVVKEAGMTVEHATDGLEALKKATALKPKVMIVDVGLTGIYGFELCERLKGDPDTRSIKIILLSSVYGLTAYKRSPVTLYGADDYIEKHHIPDKLLAKIKQHLSGMPAAAAAVSPAPLPTAAGTPAAASPVPETASVTAAPPAAGRSVPAATERLAALDAADVMPKAPVTLDSTRKRATPPVFQQAVPLAAGGTQALPPLAAAPQAAEKKETTRPEGTRPVVQDESVKLDAAFFEQEEYAAPAKPPAKAAPAVDPAEVEKARRFARLVVSDIALYNQETVTEGIAKGTFFELLKDDIAEGRALYEKRVPEAVRATDDYYQEAFDNFIATKKKQR